MLFVSRFTIVFVGVLFADKITSGLNIENQWYEFVWGLFVGFLNACLHPVLTAFNSKKGWFVIGFWTLLLNLFLYWTVSMGAAKWIGITFASSFWAYTASIIVSFISTICTHFRDFMKK